MAETFGAVAGAISIAALFNNCVQCFGYIQLGRSFGRDYQTCQLRLDSARLRLSRWGEAVHIYHSERLTSEPREDDPEARMAVAYFEEIQHLIEGVQRSAKRYQLAHPDRDTSLGSSEDLTVAGKTVHNRAAEIARRRQKATGTLKKITWALYDGQEFERLVSQIVSLLDELERVFPVESACRRLVEMEIEEVDDESSLAALKEAAEGTDQMMAEAVTSKMLLIGGSNSAGAIQTAELADVQVGNRYSDGAMAPGHQMMDRTNNSVELIAARGSSRVHIGNSYGST